MISSRALAQTLVELVDSKGEERGMEEFFTFVKSRHLEYLLPNTLKHATRILEERRDNSKVTVTTSHPISAEVLKEVASKVGASSEGEIDHLLDEGLVGGFIAEYRNRLYDASIKTQLIRLREELRGMNLK